MAVEGRQAPSGARIPKLDLVVFRPRHQKTFCRVPIARFDVPVMTCKNGVGSSCGEVEDL